MTLCNVPATFKVRGSLVIRCCLFSLLRHYVFVNSAINLKSILVWSYYKANKLCLCLIFCVHTCVNKWRMLRTCCECIFGSNTNEPTNDHSNGYIDLNKKSQNSSAWSEVKWSNKNMFLVPRKLSPGDTVTISGTMRRHPNSLSISLMAGHNYNIDYQNIPCQLEANFNENNLSIKIIQNGIAQVIEGSYTQIPAGDIIIDSKFDISFTLKLSNVSDAFLDIISGDNLFIDQIVMQHSFRDIGFIAMDGDVQHMGAIQYNFGSPLDGTLSVIRKINSDETITLSGPLATSPDSITISLITGYDQADFENIACQVEAKFFEDEVIITTVLNGEPEVTKGISKASELIADSNFNLSFMFKQDNFSNEYINIMTNSSFVNQLYLKHRMEDIKYIVINGDMLCITTLKFQLSQYE